MNNNKRWSLLVYCTVVRIDSKSLGKIYKHTNTLTHDKIINRDNYDNLAGKFQTLLNRQVNNISKKNWIRNRRTQKRTQIKTQIQIFLPNCAYLSSLPGQWGLSLLIGGGGSSHDLLLGDKKYIRKQKKAHFFFDVKMLVCH